MRLTKKQLAAMAVAHPATEIRPIVSAWALLILDGLVVGEVRDLSIVPAKHEWVDRELYAESDVGSLIKWPRARRNMLLAASDWSQAVDVPETTRTKWAAYRAALRDLPNACPDALKIQWPLPPTAPAITFEA